MLIQQFLDALNGGEVVDLTHPLYVYVTNSPLTTFTTKGPTAAIPTDAADGTTWTTLLNQSVLTKPTKINGFIVTVSAGWLGKCRLRVVTAAGTKIWPFGASVVQDTDWTSGVLSLLGQELTVPIINGYILQFSSNNVGDVAATGATATLTELDVVEIG